MFYIFGTKDSPTLWSGLQFHQETWHRRPCETFSECLLLLRWMGRSSEINIWHLALLKIRTRVHKSEPSGIKFKFMCNKTKYIYWSYLFCPRLKPSLSPRPRVWSLLSRPLSAYQVPSLRLTSMLWSSPSARPNLHVHVFYNTKIWHLLNDRFYDIFFPKRSMADGFKSVFSAQYFWLLPEYQWLEEECFSAASQFTLYLVLFQHFKAIRVVLTYCWWKPYISWFFCIIIIAFQ